MERLFEYLTDLSGGAAYFIIFGILVACGLGFPLPEDIPLIATGYLIWDHTLSWPGGIAVTLLGVVIGDTILFFIGQRLGLTILKKNNKKKSKLFSEKRIRRSRAYFRKYGDKVVFFARFVAGIRAVAFFMAGAMHMKYRRFIFLDGLAALISVPIWIILGYYLGHFFGDEISDLLLRLKEIKTVFTVVMLCIVGGVVIRSLMQYRAAKKPQLAKSKKKS